jgi:hypothetical protein
MVSIPYNGTVSKYAVEIINETGVKKSWNNSVSSNWILNFVYLYDGSVYHATNDFTAYDGFWMYFYIDNASLYYSGVDNATGCASIDDAIDYLNNYTTYAAGLTFDSNQYITVIFVVILFMFAYLGETAEQNDHMRRALNFFLAGIIALFGGVSLTQFLPWYYSFVFLTAMGFYWIRAFNNFGKLKKIS